MNRDALLRALIYRALRRCATLADLVRALEENPSVLEAVGLDPFGPLPRVERFSDWLHGTDARNSNSFVSNCCDPCLQRECFPAAYWL